MRTLEKRLCLVLTAMLFFGMYPNKALHADYSVPAPKTNAVSFLMNDFQVNGNAGYASSQVFQSPDLAVAGNGNFTVVWEDDRNGCQDIFARFFNGSGAAAGPSFKVNDDAGYSTQTNPCIAANADGDFVIAWQDLRDGNYNIYARRFNASGTAQAPGFKVNDDAGTFFKNNPSIGLDGSGNYTIVWEDYRNGNYNIYAQRYNAAGTAQGSNFRANDDAGTTFQRSPAVCVHGGGSFIVTWYDSRNGNYDIYAQRYDVSGTPQGSNFKVNDDTGTAPQVAPSIAMDGNGNFTIVWCDIRDWGSARTVYAQKYSNTGVAIGVNFMVTDNVVTGNRNPARIAIGSGGNVMVSWDENRGSSQDIFAQMYDNAWTALGANFKVNDDAGNASQYSTAIGADGSGNFVVAWEDSRNNGINNNEGNSDIYVQRYNGSGTVLGSNIKVNDPPEGSAKQYNPSLGVDGSGNFMVAWEDYRNGHTDIFVQRYNNLGAISGVYFRLNDDAGTASQANPSVAMNESGYHVAAWVDSRNGNADIYAQRYSSSRTAQGTNFKVNDVSSSWGQGDPSVAVDGSGNCVVVWDYSLSGGIRDIYAQRYDGSGAAIGSNFKVNDNSAGAYLYFPTVAIDAGGNFIVAWTDRRNSSSDIYGQRYNISGTALGTNFRVNDDNGTSSQSNSCVAVNADGEFIIAWLDGRNANGGDVYAQRYTGSGTAMGPNFKVTDENTANNYPTVAFTPDGYFMIAWTDKRNGYDDVYAQRYRPDGKAIGFNYRATQTTAGNQQTPDFRILGNSVTLCWQTDHVGGTGWDVWANKQEFFQADDWLAGLTVTPASGPVGSTVTIGGVNFDSVPSNNIVYFGAVKAPVTSGSPTSLTATVPAGASYEPVTVTTAGLTNFSNNPFTVTFNGGFISSGSFAPKLDFTAENQPWCVAKGDLDGDGKPDLVVSIPGISSISVYRNLSMPGIISMADKSNYTTGSEPWNVAVGDLDGDGRIDLAVADGKSNTVSAFRNTSSIGSISFAERVHFETDKQPYGVTIHDLDGDGKPDLIVTNGDSNTVSLLRNTSVPGSISFDPRVDLPTGVGPWGAAVTDLDGDNKPDIMVTNHQAGTVSVFRNIGVAGILTAASFSPKEDFTTGNFNFCPVTGDFDGDGKRDLAVVEGERHVVTVLRNTSSGGSISFAPKLDFPSGEDPWYLAAGDLDGDGKPDLAAVNGQSHTVSVYKNTGTPGNIAFAAKVDFPTGTTPWGLAIGDMDIDGRLDLVVTNWSSSMVSVLRNSIDAPPVIESVTVNPRTLYEGQTMTITARVTDAETAVASVQAEIENPDESVVATLTLYDDGTHSDGAAGDHVYGNTCLVPSAGSNMDYPIDILAGDDQSNTATSNNAVWLRVTRRTQASDYAHPIPKTLAVPVIDGKQDAVWKTLEATFQSSYDNGNTLPDSWADLFGCFKMMWDDQNLYGLFYTQDDSIHDVHANTWERDAVELYLDADNSKGLTGFDGVNDMQFNFRHEFISDPAGNLANLCSTTLTPPFSTSGVQFAVRNDTTTMGGWWTEFKIPLANLKITSAAGTKIGLEWQQDDNDGDNRDHISKWCQDYGDDSWLYPNLWGTAVLSDRTVSNTLEIAKTTTPPVVDGTLDVAYLQANPVTQNSFGNGSIYPDDFHDIYCRTYTLYDNSNLYVYYDVYDDVRTTTATNIWEKDAVEIFMDADNSKGAAFDGANDMYLVFKYAFKDNPASHLDELCMPSFSTTAGIVYAITDDDLGYNVEIKLPLADLKINPIPGSLIGFELQHDDNDNGVTRDHVSKWWLEHGDDSWHQPSVWGTAKLGGSAEAASFSFPLQVSGASVNMTMTIGGNPSGTNGFDTGLDVISPPIPQTYYSYFQISSFPNSLSTDVRKWDSPYDTAIDWTLKIVNADGVSTTITWNPANLPSQGNFTITGAGSVNMRTTGTFGFTGNKTLTIQYRLAATANYTFAQAGWYMVSLPVLPADSSVSTLFPAALGGMAFGWDAQSGTYTTETKMKPKKGYWLAIPSSASSTVSGLPLNSYTDHYPAQGWYMIGSVLGGTNFVDPNDNPNGSVLSPAFGWNLASGTYEPATTLNEKQGYWIAVFNACDLNVGGIGGETPAPMAKADWEAFYNKYGKTPPSPPNMDGKTALAETTPKAYGLFQNYPNPFNPETTIRYQIPDAGSVRLAIYNTMGQVVRILVDGHQNPGSYEAVWDGKDGNGRSLVSGMYLCRIQSGRFSSMVKLILMK